MKFKAVSTVFILSVFLLGFGMESSKQTSKSMNLDIDIEKKVEKLLKKMTLEEKIGQMNQYNGSWDVTGPAPDGNNREKYDQLKSGMVGSMLNVVGANAVREAQKLAVENSRLGIPLIFGYDVIHGFQTIFPVPLGESASWDLEAIELSAKVAAKESSASGISWTFAPMVDINRDARWGRVMEGAGEDPYLGSKIAVARVNGFQGNDLSDGESIAACAKHFAAYGFAESGRDYNTADVGEHTLRNVILPPFKACIDAGVATVMNAFNEIGGIPATGNKYLQRDILKEEWGFDGFVISDWGSIGEMIAHGYSKDCMQASEQAVNAGSDMDMESYCYINSLKQLVEEGKVEESTIDDAVRRILRVKYKLGLFENPYLYCDLEREKTDVYSKENLEIARDVARKSIVLLKNEMDILPLKKSGKKIAVIGPLGNHKDAPLGSWRAKAIENSAVSLLEGIQNKVGEDVEVKYAQGCGLSQGKRNFLFEVDLIEEDKSGFAEAKKLAVESDVVIMALGEDCWQTGEGRSQTEIGLPGSQMDLLKEIHKINKNIVIVLMNGRPLTLNWEEENVPAIVETWQLGSEAGNAIADVLFGDYNPSGKLPVSFPRAVGQLPLYYNYKNTGRPDKHPEGMVFWSHFTDEENTPLYPFGYGLSYSKFDYSKPTISSNNMSMNGSVKISVEVSNKGAVDGAEVVQLYIRDLIGTITRPVKELKGFEKVQIKAGETKTVSFELKQEDLAFYGADGTFKAEEGDFEVFVGGNSRDVQKMTFSLK